MTEKSVAEKLYIKPGRRARFINAPEGLVGLLGGLPDGVSLLDHSDDPSTVVQAEIIVLFANSRTELETLLPGLRAALAPGGMIWVAYHKGTSRVKTDIHRDTINAYAKSVGMEGIAIISIDEDWSALRLKLIEQAKS